MNIKCVICGKEFDEKVITTISPSKYLGNTFPGTADFCPVCYRKFLIKAKEQTSASEEGKLSNLKNFTNT